MSPRWMLIACFLTFVFVGLGGCRQAGRPQAVLPQRSTVATIVVPPHSAGNGLLVYSTIEENAPDVRYVRSYAVWRTATGHWTARVRLFNIHNSDATPRLDPSPDGRAVVLTVDVTNWVIMPDYNDLLVYSFARKKLDRITYDNAGYEGVLWSSDSRYFACVGHSEWVKDRSRWTLYLYDVGKRAIKRVAHQVVTYSWGALPGRLLFQKDRSLVLYEYDAAKRRTLAVGRMPPARFAQILGQWAQVDNWPKAGQTYYRLVASRKGRQTTVRAVHWLNLRDSVVTYSNLLSPDGTRLILSGRRERPVILDLPRRTLRYFMPAPDRSYSVGWSSDGKAVIVYVYRIFEGPDSYPNARVFSVPLASLPESPIGRVDWERPHRPKLTLIKELGPGVQAMRWVGPGNLPGPGRATNGDIP